MAYHLDRRAKQIVQAAVGADDDEVMVSKECAAWLGVSTAWLQCGRAQNFGPPYVRLGRSIRYRRRDVLQWLDSRRTHCEKVAQAKGKKKIAT